MSVGQDREELSGRGGTDRCAVSEPGDLDRPGMPSGADAWDAPSGEWLAAAPGPNPLVATSAEAGASAGTEAEAGPAADALPAPADPEPGKRRVPGPHSRRGAVDPVKTLLHRHRELCERAVDPLEIAAGLEAHGVTDRTAARFRHRDVFSLAEELYARVPRDGDPRQEPEPLPAPRVRTGWVLLTVLPGALGAATVTALRLTDGHTRLLVALGGVLAAALATRAALRHGPLADRSGTPSWRTASAARAWTLWLLGYALLGDGLLHAVLTGGPDTAPTGTPDGPWPTATAPVLALLLACAPAAWCAHLLTAGARRRLAGSRGLEDFSSAAKPLLLGTFALFLGALTTLLLLCGTTLREPVPYPRSVALGALLLLARLLTVHRHRHAPVLALGAAAAVEAAALALPTAARLPGCAFLATPVETLVNAGGSAAVPALACGTAALALLLHAVRALTQASAHAPAGAPE
ncbi:hypothetical protein SAMN05428944_2931 [Streptomyces sp. 1222.5]|nr:MULTISPECIES: hypothetical protein [unclassified Streptomyces]PKW09901.1 hypothetical protein BX260_5160 [Streptomyces sp. 5112.2]SEC21344.1 hypothetical protein SAMN05428944_2931 [Streptomyces sp. 1222.5]